MTVARHKIFAMVEPSSRHKYSGALAYGIGAILFLQFRREMHRLDDFRVGRTAAQIAGEVVPYVVVAGIGSLHKELVSHQDEARRAETALEGSRLDEGLLNW